STDIGAALGVPLHGHEEPGIVWVVVRLDGLDYSVFRAASNDLHPGSGFGDRLVMAGVYGQAQEPVAARRLSAGERAQKALRGDVGHVGDSDLSAGRVVHRQWQKILNQRTSTVDVQR